MASQSYIMTREEHVVQMLPVIRGITKVAENELQINDGRLYPENRDCWNTLLVNLDDLQRKIERLKQLINGGL